MFSEIVIGDSLESLRGLDDGSVDSVVTDPPYELGFMGKKWDGTGVAYSVELWREVLRVLKPGGHLLAFGGTRTYHRMTCAIEDAGFEIRDSLHWLYGTGFPKSLNLGDGRGTALKPAHEPIVLARKPLAGTVAANVLAHGTGALNIDASRIHSGPSTGGSRRTTALGQMNDDGWQPQEQGIDRSMAAGRWPANVVLSHAEDCADTCAPSCPVAELDRQSAEVSRFFYVSKPSRKERDRGCEALPARSAGEATDREDGSEGLNSPRAGAGRTGGAKNYHPTVKPVRLMRHLVKMITPPGGLVLDPFTGSGTTGVAAALEGLDFLGLEREEEYVRIAESRIASATETPEEWT